jgi:hypothetical protein
MRTTWPSTTSPCLKLLMSESCSASSSSIVVGSGPSGRAARGLVLVARGRRVRGLVVGQRIGRRRRRVGRGDGRVGLRVLPPRRLCGGGIVLGRFCDGGLGDGASAPFADAAAAISSASGSAALVSAVLVAGSSATATAATVSLGRLVGDGGVCLPAPAWSRPAALQSIVWSLLVVDLRPRITNGLSDAQAVSEAVGWSVVMTLAVRSLRASTGPYVARAVRAPWGRESLAQAL